MPVDESELIILVALKEIDRALIELLLDNIRKRQGTLTYKEAAESLSQRLGRQINPHYGLAASLGAISTLCFELGLPLISARVIYAEATSAKNVGKGFYPLACSLKPEYSAMDPVDVWKRELSLVRACGDWDRLQQYLDGTYESSAPTISTVPTVKNPFVEWLSQTSPLAKVSIRKYAGAVGTVSSKMYERGLIQKPLENMPLSELDRALSVIMSDMEFITRNTRNNHMYSNALKHYRYYVHAVCEHGENVEYLDSIKNDSAIPETQRTAIIQSRVGQGVFRKLLMEKYSGSCIITGLDHPKLLVASHIKPWAVSTNAERLSVDNGLLLSATYDRLFDCGLITFKKTGKYISHP